MRKMWLSLLAVLLIIVVAPLAIAQMKESEKPSAIVTEMVTVTATVEAIDYEKRTLTLKGPEGNIDTVKVDKRVENFDQVKKGDIVEIEHFESIAIFVEKAEGEPSVEDIRVVEVAPRGAKPGIVTTETIRLTARVEAIDYKNRTVTLRGPQGNIVTLTVDESVKRLDQVKVGDEVVVRHTESVAISVRKP